MFVDQLRSAVQASPRHALPGLSALLWKALAENQVSEADAEILAGEIERRQTPAPKPLGASRKPVGTRPRSDASMERRRRWAASGRLPPALAAKFTLAEQAVLAVVANQVREKGDCRLPIGHIAALAGVSDTSVRNALRQARLLGLLTIEERRLTAWRNAPNVVRIVSAEWVSWMRLGRPVGGGCKLAKGTNIKVLDNQGSQRGWARRRNGFRGEEVGLTRSARFGLRIAETALSNR